MTLLIASVSLRQLVRQRRMLLLVLLALVPVGVSVVFRLAAPQAEDESTAFAVALLSEFVVNLVLPLTALLVGTSVLGQDLDEGTVVYLLTKPLARRKIILAKLAAAWTVTAGVTAGCVLAVGAVVLLGRESPSIMLAFIVATAAGGLAYVTIFVTLSLRFSRALVIGLAYVFVWEAIISRFIPGVRFLSVRAYTLGITDGLTEWTSDEFPPAALGLAPAVVLLGLLVAAGSWYAHRLLNRYEISERV